MELPACSLCRSQPYHTLAFAEVSHLPQDIAVAHIQDSFAEPYYDSTITSWILFLTDTRHSEL